VNLVRKGQTGAWLWRRFPIDPLLLLIPILVAVCVATPQHGARSDAPVDGYQIVHVYPHDPAAFTQGLEFVDGFLYEGTGLNGQSSIRKVKLETGEVVQSRPLGAEYFGEGITLWQSRLIQLTWQSQVGFVYDAATFTPQRTFQYVGEGWGLTHDGSRLIKSEGSDTLRFWNPDTLAEERAIHVTDGDVAIRALNELEFVRGEIYANVWQTDRIARINPANGRVNGWIDLTGLLPSADRTPAVDVLNGIAYDAAGARLFVTGKRWPKVFEIKTVRR
jgi:glutamine cyclotransferase